MQEDIYNLGNSKFQGNRTAVEESPFINQNLEAGKKFECEFAIAFRKTGLRLERLLDSRYNKPACDHYAVITPKLGLPGMITFFEVKSTGCRELPMEDIKPHQLEAMGQYDHTFPNLYAGFVVHYRNVPGEPVVYLPGRTVQSYVQNQSGMSYMPADYIERHGIVIPQYTPALDERMRNRLDIRSFLSTLSKT